MVSSIQFELLFSLLNAPLSLLSTYTYTLHLFYMFFCTYIKFDELYHIIVIYLLYVICDLLQINKIYSVYTFNHWQQIFRITQIIIIIKSYLERASEISRAWFLYLILTKLLSIFSRSNLSRRILDVIILIYILCWYRCHRCKIYICKQLRPDSVARNSRHSKAWRYRLWANQRNFSHISSPNRVVRPLLGQNRLQLWRFGSRVMSHRRLRLRPNGVQRRGSIAAGDPSWVHPRHRFTGLLRCQLGRRVQSPHDGGCEWRVGSLRIHRLQRWLEPKMPGGAENRRRQSLQKRVRRLQDPAVLLLRCVWLAVDVFSVGVLADFQVGVS